MLLGLVFLIHSFGFIKVEDIGDSTKDSDYSLLHGIKELSKDRYYIYFPNKNDSENGYITTKIYTKLKFRDVPTNPQKLWPKAVVPFVISRKCNWKQKKIILEAMKRYKLQTCVRFAPRKNETAFIMITPGRRCDPNLGNKKDPKQLVVKSCYELNTIIHELMNILDLKVELNKHDRRNSPKNFGKDIHLLQGNDATKINFAKVNNIFGCNIKKSNDSRDRISGRPLEVSTETNRSNRRKRNAGMPHHSHKLFSKEPPVKKCTEHNATTIEVATTEVTSENNVTSTDPSTAVTTDKNVTSTDPVTKVFTDNNVTATVPATKVTIENNVTSTDPATKVSTDNIITSTVPATKVTTDNIVTSTVPATKVTIENNVTSTDPPTDVTTGNNVTSTDPTTTVGCPINCKKPINEVFFHNIDIISSVLPRTSIIDPAKLWSKPEIPYELSEDKYDSSQKSLIRKAIAEFANKTCVKFIPRTTEETYISLQPTKGCSAGVGKVAGGVNNVSLVEGCFRRGTILHELMHTLGFIHEQNRPDRDKFVMVVWDNILPEARHNFKKEAESAVTSFNQSYDYGSVMHYGRYDFAVNDDQPTLVPLQKGVEIGQRDGFSKTDIIKINKLFSCKTEEDEKIIEPKPKVSVKEFARKFLDYVSKLFKSIYRTMRKFQVDTKEQS